MRTLSLVDCVELKFPGNVMKEALCFGDADNDGVSELIVGNTDGDLFIYKDDKCICRAFDLGCIAAIAVGDLLNLNRNVTVVVTTEGYCHVFDVEDELSGPLPEDNDSRHEASISSLSVDNLQTIPIDCRIIQQFHSQRIVANTKVMFLADVNDDGANELVVGLTDRVLRTYKWNPEPIEEFNVLQIEERDLLSNESNLESIVDSPYGGRLQAVNKWELAQQIGSIAPHQQGNLVSILIGQPGGTITRITEISSTDSVSKAREREVKEDGASNNKNSVGSSQLSREGSIDKELPPGDEDHSMLRHPTPSDNISIKYHPLNSSSMRCQNITTHVAANIVSHDGSNEDSYAVGTWDGTIMICKDDLVEWSFQVDKPLMTVQSFCGNGIFVDWEGPTYVINRRVDSKIENCVFRFCFEDHVAAFRVGMYGMRQYNNGNEEKSDIINQKCLAYATFHGSIYVYPNEFL